MKIPDIDGGKTEEIILKYNPSWTGKGDTRKHVWVPDEYLEFFDITFQNEFDVNVSFTKEGWHGRMKACRGVGDSMTEEPLKLWEADHKKMLDEMLPQGAYRSVCGEVQNVICSQNILLPTEKHLEKRRFLQNAHGQIL